MKKTLLLFILLISLASFAQTNGQYTGTIFVNDPPYGFVAQLWNGSTSTLILDHIDITSSPEQQQIKPGGIFMFGIGYSNIQEPGCTVTQVLYVDPVNGPTLSNDTSLSHQPCTFPYIATNNLGLPVLSFCYGISCTIDYPQGLPVLPGRGVTIYTAYYISPDAFGWNGYIAANFKWHNSGYILR